MDLGFGMKWICETLETDSQGIRKTLEMDLQGFAGGSQIFAGIHKTLEMDLRAIHQDI